MAAPPTKLKVIASYSHKDKNALKELQTHLSPFASVSLWDDTKIGVGNDWKKEIEDELDAADIGVLLVTPNFFSSKFITETELPKILADKHVFWIAYGASSFEESPLGTIQCANDPSKPLATLTKSIRDQHWVEICKKLKNAINP